MSSMVDQNLLLLPVVTVLMIVQEGVVATIVAVAMVVVVATVVVVVCRATYLNHLMVPSEQAISIYFAHFALDDLRSVQSLHLLGHLKPK